MRVLFAFVAFLVTAVSTQDLTGPNFYITGGDGTNYIFTLSNGTTVPDPALTLNVGTTYKFYLNVSMPNHPFGFTVDSTSQVSNFSSPDLLGATVSGECSMGTDNNPFSLISTNISDPCIVSITPAQAVQSLVYYRCSIHQAMNGALNIAGGATATPPATPTPTSSTNTTDAPTPTATPTPGTGGNQGGAACIVPSAIAVIAVAINALFSA